jgi:large subunit ribosomal protein L10
MATQEKIDIVQAYTDKFKSAKSVYLTDFSGIDVVTVTEMRKKFRESNIEYKVLKNRLAKRSLQAADISALDEHLTGVNAFVISYDDPVAPAKIIKEYNKKKELLKLKVVYLEGQVFAAEKAAALADLPSREELLAKFVGLLQAPIAKLMATLQAPMQKLAGTLDAVKNSK